MIFLSIINSMQIVNKNIVDKNIVNKNISLIGFMGSGKTTIGNILAEKLNFLFLDLDKIIEISENLKISEIFEKYGEVYFRNIESSIVEKVYDNENCVFSCGGGVVLNEKNMEIIKKNSTVIYLKANAKSIIERLKGATDRPLLLVKDKEKKIKDLMNARKELYVKYADLIVDTNNKIPSDIVNDILRNLNYLK